MTTFDICLSKTRCHDIPIASTRERQAREIAKNMFSIQNDQVRTFVSAVGTEGYSFCPSIFTNAHLSKDTFKQTQLFALSFNNLNSSNVKKNRDFSFDDIAQRARQYNLPIFFAYDIFSSFSWESDHQMFCIVFLNEVPICGLREAETIQKALLTIFPEADKKYNGVIDLHFGGNKILYFDETLPTINPDIVLMNMCFYLKNRYGSTNYKRKIISFAEERGIVLDGRNLPVVSIAEELRSNTDFNIDKYYDENPDRIPHQKNNKNSPKPIIYNNRDFGEKLSRLNYMINFQKDAGQGEPQQSMITKKHHIHQPYRSGVIKSLGFSCELYHEFESNDNGRSLSNKELFGLATNLALVESGEKTFMDILKSKSSNGDSGLALSNWDYYFYYIKRRNPYPCSSFCPYHRTCTHGQNILSTCSIRPHQIERVSNDEDQLVSLDEACEDFKKKFNMAVDSSEKVWHVIKSQTALGKTQTVLQLLKDHPGMKVLIVVPTNKLKREIAERAKTMDIHLDVSPSLHEIEDSLSGEVWDDIEALLDSGKSPIPRIIKAIKKEKKCDAKILKRYLSERDKFYGSAGCAITTHRRLSSVDLEKYDLVIIDEDYIFSTVLADRVTVYPSELKRLKKKLPARDSLCAKIKKILKKK